MVIKVCPLWKDCKETKIELFQGFKASPYFICKHICGHDPPVTEVDNPSKECLYKKRIERGRAKEKLKGKV